jgi:hypothetical protein
MRGDKPGFCAIIGSSLQSRSHLMSYLDFWPRSTISSRTWLALPLADGKFINVPTRSSCFLTRTNAWTCPNFSFSKCYRSSLFHSIVVPLWVFEVTSDSNFSSASSFFSTKMSQCCTIDPASHVCLGYDILFVACI